MRWSMLSTACVLAVGCHLATEATEYTVEDDQPVDDEGTSANAATGGPTVGAGGMMLPPTTGAGATGGAPPPCTDNGTGEPTTDTYPGFDLGEGFSISECDPDGGTVAAVLSGPDEFDYFYFYGTPQDAICVVDPLVTVSADVSVQVCVGVICNEGETQYTCPGTLQQGGWCCAQDAVSVPDANCAGAPDNMFLVIALASGNAMCTAYSLSYHF